MNTAELIRSARLQRGMTQAELARRLDTKQSAVARWEAGRVSPRVETLDRILRACGGRLEINLAFEAADAEQDELDQIRERLAWSPRERLRYLTDMVAFEQRAHRARRLGPVEREP